MVGIFNAMNPTDQIAADLWDKLALAGNSKELALPIIKSAIEKATEIAVRETSDYIMEKLRQEPLAHASEQGYTTIAPEPKYDPMIDDTCPTPATAESFENDATIAHQRATTPATDAIEQQKAVAMTRTCLWRLREERRSIEDAKGKDAVPAYLKRCIDYMSIFETPTPATASETYAQFLTRRGLPDEPQSWDLFQSAAHASEQETPEYQQFLAECAKHCRCSMTICESVLAGAPCEERIEPNDLDDNLP